MGVKESWNNLYDLLREIQTEDLYKAAGERLPGCVRDLVLYDDELEATSGGLVHYTSWDNLLKMLDVQGEQVPVLRMYNYESANDPEEGKIKPPEWNELKEEVETLAEEYLLPESHLDQTQGGSTYGCSFSTSGKGVEDHLMFWRLYGNNGKGASLKLGVVPGMDLPTGMYKVRYRENNGDRRIKEERNDDREVAKRVKQFVNLGRETIEAAPETYKRQVGNSVTRALQQTLEGYTHLVKSSAYEHEQEWRMIKVTPPSSDDVKYSVNDNGVVRRFVERGRIVDLFGSASVITLGPRVPNEYGAAKGYIEALIKKHRMERIRVETSKQRYR